MSFEERLEKLEALAQKMEQDALPLEALLQNYEEGIKLSQALEAELEQARARMMEVKSGKAGAALVTISQVVTQGTLLDEMEEV
jgi:exodeoxyribonuclease VII small subunit